MAVRAPSPKTVILVEPDVTERDTFHRALTDAGFAVLCFPDYIGPLQIAESASRLDLLVTAIRLPAGTPHGVSLAAMIQIRRPRLPVLLIADDDTVAQMIGDGATVLVKPIEPSELLQAVMKLMDEPRQGRKPVEKY